VYYTNRYRHHPILAKTFIINALFRKSVEYRQPGYPTVVNLRFDAVLAGIPPRSRQKSRISARFSRCSDRWHDSDPGASLGIAASQ